MAALPHPFQAHQIYFKKLSTEVNETELENLPNKEIKDEIFPQKRAIQKINVTLKW